MDEGDLLDGAILQVRANFLRCKMRQLTDKEIQSICQERLQVFWPPEIGAVAEPKALVLDLETIRGKIDWVFAAILRLRSFQMRRAKRSYPHVLHRNRLLVAQGEQL